MKTKGLRESNRDSWDYKYGFPDKYRRMVYYTYQRFEGRSWDDCYSRLKRIVPYKFHRYISNHLPEFPNVNGEYVGRYIRYLINANRRQILTVDNIEEHYFSYSRLSWYVKDGILYKAKVKPIKRKRNYKRIEKKISPVEKVYKFKYDLEHKYFFENEIINRWSKINLIPLKHKLRAFLNKEGFVSNCKSDIVDVGSFTSWCDANNITYKLILTAITKNIDYGKSYCRRNKRETEHQTIIFRSNA